MNRIRAIATAGIVAGLVAFAAALLSSGGVGASFVDAAEAGASISVAPAFPDGLKSKMLIAAPTACAVTSETDDAQFAFSTGDDSETLDLASLDSAGTHTATINLTIANRSAFDVSSTWAAKSTPILTVTGTEPASGSAVLHSGDPAQPVSVTFSWADPSDGGAAVNGTGTITVVCTPSNDSNAAADGDRGGKQDSSDPGDSAEPNPSPITYTLNLEINIPAAESDQKIGVPEEPATCEKDDPTPSEECTSGEQAPDCAPDGADAADTDKCKPADPASPQS